MSICLAIDTTARRGSLAIADGDRILASRVLEPSDGFAAVVYSEAASLLETAGCGLAAVDVFAAASGPGSFTGVRVGLTAVKALAEGGGKAVVPVSNLRALASMAVAERTAAVLDARRGEIYAAVFGDKGDELIPESAFEWDAFRQQAGAALFVATSESVFGPEGTAPLPASSRRLIVENLAEPIARLANRSTQALPPELVEPNYIRRPDAERNWKSPLA